MHLWTKAVVLLIVTNSMDSSYLLNSLQKTIHLRDDSAQFKCSASDQDKLVKTAKCVQKKYGIDSGDTSDPDFHKRDCCAATFIVCETSAFIEKNCELKSGYEAFKQQNRETATKACRSAGVDPDKDCEPLILPMPESCPQLECDSYAKPPNVIQEIETTKPNPEVTSKPNPEVTSKPNPEVTSKPNPIVTSKPNPEVTSKPNPIVTSKPNPEVTSKPTLKPTPTTTVQPLPVLNLAKGIHISMSLIVVSFVTKFIFF